MVESAGAATSVDVGQIIDNGEWTTMQKVVVFFAALSIVLDGFDGQLIGFAIPVIIKEWGVSRGDFAPVVATGLVGMGIGSACAGLFADRFGRRWAVIASVFLFGFATCLIGLSQNLLTIALLRFAAGLGIGGALPSSTTVTAEFTPARRRTLAITATIVCVPLGGMLAGFFASFILPAYGWRGLFLIGGAIPMIMGLILFTTIPESPRFLVRHPERWGELQKLLAKMSRPTAAGAVYTDIAEQKMEKRDGFPALFQSGLARDTAALWSAFFMTLLAVYAAFSWLPTMLASEGLDVAVAGSGLTAYNLGGVLGALGCAVAITRFGSRWPLGIACIVGAASAFALTQVNPVQSTSLFIAGIGLHGLCTNAVQSTMYAVCAYVYPTSVRATGTASALAFGRLGAIFSAFAGAAIITAAGGSGYLVMLGFAMLVSFASLMLLSRHIPPLARISAATKQVGAGVPAPHSHPRR